MIGRIFTKAVRNASRKDEVFNQEGEATKRETETFSFVAMRPLAAPAAQNDDPLLGFCQEIEQDLRASGYLK